MKKYLTFIIVFLFTLTSFSQTALKDEVLKSKLDSILVEADLLYSYEKVAWKASDIVVQKESLKHQIGGYIVYHSNDTVSSIFIDKSSQKRIAKITFTKKDLTVPYSSDYNQVELSSKEKKLLEIRKTIINQFSNPVYQVTISNGYSPNLVLIEEETGYKFYIIMGTNQPEIIPFGNDYLFKTDKNGIITSARKFHRTVIPAQTKMKDGSEVVSVIHSHLKMIPLITATDICTFRLYGELYQMNEFRVLSTALGKYFKYTLKTNTIEVIDIE